MVLVGGTVQTHCAKELGTRPHSPPDGGDPRCLQCFWGRPVLQRVLPQFLGGERPHPLCGLAGLAGGRCVGSAAPVACCFPLTGVTPPHPGLLCHLTCPGGWCLLPSARPQNGLCLLEVLSILAVRHLSGPRPSVPMVLLCGFSEEGVWEGLHFRPSLSCSRASPTATLHFVCSFSLVLGCWRLWTGHLQVWLADLEAACKHVLALKKRGEKICWRRGGECGALLHCGWGREGGPLLWEAVGRVPEEVNTERPYDPALWCVPRRDRNRRSNKSPCTNVRAQTFLAHRLQ